MASSALDSNLLQYIPKDIEGLLCKFVKEQQPEVTTKLIVSEDCFTKTPEYEHIPGTVYNDSYIFLRVFIRCGGMEQMFEMAWFEECEAMVHKFLKVLNNNTKPTQDMNIYKHGNSYITIAYDADEQEYPLVIKTQLAEYTNGKYLMRFKWENREIIKEILKKLIELSQIEIRDCEDDSDDDE